MSPGITVVIPVYNASEFIAETIDAVRQQTFADFELLVINDGSTDNTAEIVRQYQQHDSRIRLICQPNQGVSVARNTGIQAAQAEFIAFLDADDYWFPEKLAAHVKHLTDFPKLGISFGRVEFMTDDGQATGQFSSSRLHRLSPRHLYYENLVVTPSNAVIRRSALEAVGGFDPDLSGVADVELFLRVLCHGWQVEGLNRLLVRYRTSLGGMSAQLYRMEEEWQRFSDKVQAYAPELVKDHYNLARAMLLRYLARRTLRLHLPATVGADFMTRSLQADWRLLIQEPRRTLLTMIAIYGQTVLRGFASTNP